MRTIKFRAWHYLPEKMTYGIENAIGNTCFAFGHLIHDNDVEVMQFTGLKDKNEKEIYEGDIIIYDRGVGNWTGKRMSTTHTVVFSEEVFAFVMDYGSSYIKLRKHWNYTYEVIGNIHDNPELLSTPAAVL